MQNVQIGLTRAVTNTKTGATGHSVYVFEGHRGKGHMSGWIKSNSEKTIFTVPDCNLEAYLACRRLTVFGVPTSDGFVRITSCEVRTHVNKNDFRYGRQVGLDR